jgi:hypothetical protein
VNAEQLFAKARALAEAAADAAVQGGEYPGADPTELASKRYFEGSEPVLKALVAALSAAERTTLWPDDELWELLANEWFEAWEERTAQAR